MIPLKTIILLKLSLQINFVSKFVEDSNKKQKSFYGRLGTKMFIVHGENAKLKKKNEWKKGRTRQ